ncbi:EamA domain containing protein [Pyrenophora tritici-repentis]|nr:EamA multi-domain protein [Pyrenophora tritici-repentis]PWO28367.1 Homeodomain-containing transcription factor [Pyrenophora tritici-repentis]PZD45699.1 EamA domain containing protein [Pyrenophora tritici-repentis]
MAQSPPSKSIEDDDRPTQQHNEHQVVAGLTLKSGDNPEDALRVNRGAIRVPSPNPSVISIDDLNNIRLVQHSVYIPYHDESHASPSPAPPRTLKGRIQASWTANKGLVLVLIAQMFGRGYHPFQILFARMSITVICASLYMWYKKTEHFPFGMKEVRSLLVARGLLGFFGVFGMYYSLLYLPLADATVITFLAPSLACWACSYFINEPFTRMEQMAAYVSLLGVILIARPVSLFTAFTHSEHTVPPTSGNLGLIPSNTTTADLPGRLAVDYDSVTPTQRAMAVGLAMLGVLGAAGAITTIRWIGKRAHPLISVNYFAVWCTIVSIVAMFALPGVGFLLPNSLKDWSYLIFLGICGFVMQFLLAAGLQYEKSSRATNMLYMQMLFALAFDKLVWGTTPGALSITGSSLILGSAIYVAIHKEEPKKKVQLGESGDGDEEIGIMSPGFDSEEREEYADIAMGRLR